MKDIVKSNKDYRENITLSSGTVWKHYLLYKLTESKGIAITPITRNPSVQHTFPFSDKAAQVSSSSSFDELQGDSKYILSLDREQRSTR